jgi:hypothetical protein
MCDVVARVENGQGQKQKTESDAILLTGNDTGK